MVALPRISQKKLRSIIKFFFLQLEFYLFYIKTSPLLPFLPLLRFLSNSRSVKSSISSFRSYLSDATTMSKGGAWEQKARCNGQNRFLGVLKRSDHPFTLFLGASGDLYHREVLWTASSSIKHTSFVAVFSRRCWLVVKLTWDHALKVLVEVSIGTVSAKG